MTKIIVRDPSAVMDLGEATGGEGRRFWPGPVARAEAERGSSAVLAAALVSFEAEAVARRPTSVLLADDSDAALAAALVATKLGIPVAATEAASDPSRANGRLIAQLADAYTQAR